MGYITFHVSALLSTSSHISKISCPFALSVFSQHINSRGGACHGITQELLEPNPSCFGLQSPALLLLLASSLLPRISYAYHMHIAFTRHSQLLSWHRPIGILNLPSLSRYGSLCCFLASFLHTFLMREFTSRCADLCMQPESIKVNKLSAKKEVQNRVCV